MLPACNSHLLLDECRHQGRAEPPASGLVKPLERLGHSGGVEEAPVPELHQLSVELRRGSGHRRQAAGGAAAAAALLSAACCRRSRRAQLRVQVLGLGDGDPLSSKVVGVEAAKLSGDLGELIEKPRPTAATCMTEADGRGVPVSAEAFIHLPVAMCGGERKVDGHLLGRQGIRRSCQRLHFAAVVMA